MCAVIGFYLQQPSAEDLKMVKRVFLESSIRGLHATGLSALQGGTVLTLRVPDPAHKWKLLDKLDKFVNEDGNLYLIGHCRYSTSDILFNQPFHNKQNTFAVAHNGVISQEMPENWQKLYGYQCQTRNDSELLMHTVLAGKDPFIEWPDSSIAAVELYAEKRMRFYRNGKRPLYLTSIKNGSIITSTKDVIKRADVPALSSQSVLPGYMFEFDEHGAMLVNKSADVKDLQLCA